MEKMKREKRVLSEAAELFDLPADLVAGLPHVEVMGSSYFYMERHRGILSYSVYGKGLELVSMTGDALRIQGTIARVEWVS